MRHSVFVLQLALLMLHVLPGSAAGQDFIGQTVVEIVVEQEGQVVTDPTILNLIQTRVGQPLSVADVRQTSEHLFNLRRFDDVQTTAEQVAGGVRVRYVLVPSHPIDTIRFTGNVSLSESDLRRIVTDRLGRSPNPARVPEAVTALLAEFRRRGYPAARISPEIVPTHNPDRSTLTFTVDAGRRSRIADVQFRQIGQGEANLKFLLPEIQKGEPFDSVKVRQELDRWEERMRSQGYLEANASFAANQPDDAYLIVSVTRGPLVVVEFTGDPLPANERDRLVPVREEASADEDLLEDAKLAIERYLHAGGYRDARATYTLDEKTPGQLIIRFNVMRGPRFTVDSVRIMGNTAISTDEIDKIMATSPGNLFVAAALDARRAAVQAAFIERGFRRAAVKIDAPSLPASQPDATERRVEVIVLIDEGPRTTVRSVTFEGNTVFTDSQLQSSVPVAAGSSFLAVDVVAGRDAIALRYQNLGYLDVNVRESTAFADGDTQADVLYTIVEGEQVIVEHIIITGNEKTRSETILRELEIQEGGPLGQEALANSRANLTGMGLFRRVTIEYVQHAGDARRDVLIQVEEAARTTLAYSFGLEGTLRLRPRGPGGAAENHLDLAPRGGFEIGRRNLWGSNRSVNLFTRASFRSTDVLLGSDAVTGIPLTETNFGFNEYRVLGTFADPRVFSDNSELLVTGILEQAVRTSFNFIRKIARVEVGTRLTPKVSLAGRYQLEKATIFDEIFEPDQQLLIDRLFPEVRLSTVAGSIIRDTRDDLLDPTRGAFLLFDSNLAMRAIGSEVGFIKAFSQAAFYRQLPTQRRIIAAFSGRLGLARGFERIADGQEVKELPASVRFFAGGDSTVRGFSLDQVANADTVSDTGFPLGGNGVIILNGELRVHIGKALEGVGFVDAGNVSKFVSDLSLTGLRPAAGFGVRIASPYGPLRFDLGFNLNPKNFSGVSREQRAVFYVSLGQAF